MSRILTQFLSWMTIVQLVLSMSAFAGSWQGTATLQSEQWGTPGEQLLFTLDFSGSFMTVSAQREGSIRPLFERRVDFSKYKIWEDPDSAWLMVCVPQTSGLFEVHEWAAYGEDDRYLNYRFILGQADCEPGRSDIHAYWLTQSQSL